jgi:hypothetical protein
VRELNGPSPPWREASLKQEEEYKPSSDDHSPCLVAASFFREGRGGYKASDFERICKSKELLDDYTQCILKGYACDGSPPTNVDLDIASSVLDRTFHATRKNFKKHSVASRKQNSLERAMQQILTSITQGSQDSGTPAIKTVLFNPEQ